VDRSNKGYSATYNTRFPFKSSACDLSPLPSAYVKALASASLLALTGVFVLSNTKEGRNRRVLARILA